MPDCPVQWLLEGKQECPDRVVMNGRRFRVYGSLVRAKSRSGEQNLVATTYWVDVTESDALREAIDQALAELAEDGTLTRLSTKYFNTDISKAQ